MREETIKITKFAYDSLVEDSNWLHYLEAAGVDNWDGFAEALEMRKNDEE